MSDRIRLSSEQQAVLDADHGRLVVEASAGAGKTRVLVERYLRHVTADGIAPDRILTITFTRKAAAEMKGRIVARLRELGRIEEAQRAETGPIQTIHAFCERLLRENALEAGLDPEFEILSEAQAARLADRCVREAIAEAEAHGTELRDLLTELAGRRAWKDASPHGLLETAARTVLRDLRGAGMTPGELKSKHGDPGSLLECWQSEVLKEALPELLFAMANVPQEEFHHRLQKAYKDLGVPLPPWLRPLPSWPADLECAAHATGLAALVASAWVRFDERMEQEQALDFTALEMRAVDLVSRSDPTRERLQQSYRVVMVDEAQDVNPLQHALLDALGIDSELFVGDAQQSIYGFRQADVGLFRERRDRSEGMRLSKNYRSEEGILRFVDCLFGRLWGDGYAPMCDPPTPMDFTVDGVPDFGAVEVWRQKDRDTSGIAQAVSDLVGGGCPPRDIAILVRQGWFGNEILRALEAVGVPARVVGGTERFFTRLEVRDLANALQALADPYDDFALLATLRSPFCGLSLDAVALLAKQAPVYEALATFKSPVEEDVAKLERFYGWFEPLSRFADRLPAWELLSALLPVSGYLEALAARPGAEQSIANVRKLLGLAAQEPELGPLEFAEGIREIQDLRHKEGDAPAIEDDADVVTILTIHKSKGLEFPVVILPDTHQVPSKIPKRVEVESRKRTLTTFFGDDEALYHRWIADRRRDRDAEEELRVLYVAMTRAQKRLCVVAHESAQDGSMARTILSTLTLRTLLAGGATVRECGRDEE
jgi:ATP-dependent helicase/nuclease subunit A